MNTNGWDTISVLNVTEVNKQLAARLGELLMTFDVSWVDGFAGSYSASGSFDAWSITGGSGSDIYLRLPIKSGAIVKNDRSQTSKSGVHNEPVGVIIAGMAVTVIVNLEWVPSRVTTQAKNLQFQLDTVTAINTARQPGGISVKSVEDPRNTGFGDQVGDGIAKALLQSKDKITFIFAQTGVVDTKTATWLDPKQSTYSLHQPAGSSDQYLAILSVTDDRDISQLNSNIDSGIASSTYPLSFVISGDLFLRNVILPALPGVFTRSTIDDFSYRKGRITLASQFNLSDVQAGAIWYTPTVTSMTISVDGNAVRNATSGSVYLDLPNAYMDFSAATSNVLNYNEANQTFSFAKDPNPVTSTNDRVPWYDYIIFGPIGAAIAAIVLACVESSLENSLADSNLAGSLSGVAASVKWQGLDQITIGSGSFNDCFVLQANVA